MISIDPYRGAPSHFPSPGKPLTWGAQWPSLGLVTLPTGLSCWSRCGPLTQADQSEFPSWKSGSDWPTEEP